MNIELKCYATLAGHAPEDAGALACREGETIAALLERIGIAPEEVKIIFVNGIKAELDRTLAEGDRVGLFPAVGGG
jgi:sulfur carrier protein ThiS